VRYLVGIGNYYGLDDSIGLRIAEAVGERGLDREFRAIDLGGNLLDLVHYLAVDTERLLVVDSARMGLAPGEFAFFTPDQVVSRKRSGGIGAHEADLMNVLEFASALGQPMAAVTILGIEPAEIRTEPGLSPRLAERFDEYVTAAVGFLTSEV
jgi:hydrogenase maturation protease